MQDNLLQIDGLKTHFFSGNRVVKAVDGVDLIIKRGETLGVVGESGSGKSITAMSIMGLIPQPPGKIVAGSILFEGEDLLKKSEAEMRRIRGNSIAMIFQDPMTSLNPVLTVGEQIAENIRLHQKLAKQAAWLKAVQMLEKVGIPDAAKRAVAYPHQFSGGMRQRVMIAMALSCNPKLLIADEPTTALDVTIQAQILDLMRQLKTEMNTSIMLITHDLGVVADLCDHVLVMYAGGPVEFAGLNALFTEPKHPYTLGLMRSIPRLSEEKKQRLEPIEGQPPDLSLLPLGCRFAERCPQVMERCRIEMPQLLEVNCGHRVACLLYQ